MNEKKLESEINKKKLRVLKTIFLTMNHNQLIKFKNNKDKSKQNILIFQDFGFGLFPNLYLFS